MNQHVWWYTARASGVVAWGLVTGAVVLGLWLSLRLTKKRPRPAWTLDLHRFLGALAVVFTGVHLGGLVGDSYVHFGAAELFVPFASSWQPDAVAWGIVGLYLLLAIEITSLGMRFLPRKLWRAVHLTSYLLFAVSTIHMLTAGTDATRRPLQWAALIGIGGVTFLTVARVFATRQPRSASAARRSVPDPGAAATAPGTAASVPAAISWSSERPARSPATAGRR